MKNGAEIILQEKKAILMKFPLALPKLLIPFKTRIRKLIMLILRNVVDFK